VSAKVYKELDLIQP